MAVIVDQLDLVDTEPDPPRAAGPPVPPPSPRDQVPMLAVLRHAAGRHARVWAD
jgi:hypothetical protein